MRRREFLKVIGGAAVAGLPTFLQAQPLAMPVIGYLSGGAPGPFAPFLTAFRDGLNENGYVEGRNVAIAYRWADGNYDQLPALASELVSRNVNVIVATGGDLAARAAKAATSNIPIVFNSGDDPVITGLVSSLARPDANLTGVSFLVVELHAKRFEILTELVPKAKVVALVVNPKNPQTERVIKTIQEAALARAMELHVLNATNAREIDEAFAAIGKIKPDFCIEQSDPSYVSRREQFALLAERHAIPMIYEGRQFAESGGLVSYGSSLPSAYRQVGVYTGKILKGAKPADLPVIQPTKFELVVNLKAAKSIGLTVPEAFLLRADQVIE